MKTYKMTKNDEIVMENNCFVRCTTYADRKDDNDIWKIYKENEIVAMRRNDFWWFYDNGDISCCPAMF